jgi:hypothetical protein
MKAILSSVAARGRWRPRSSYVFIVRVLCDGLHCRRLLSKQSEKYGIDYYHHLPTMNFGLGQWNKKYPKSRMSMASK